LLGLSFGEFSNSQSLEQTLNHDGDRIGEREWEWERLADIVIWQLAVLASHFS
jgi:hypothetical protein